MWSHKTPAQIWERLLLIAAIISMGGLWVWTVKWSITNITRGTDVFPDWLGGITGTKKSRLKETDSRLLPYISASRGPTVLTLGSGSPDWFPWIQELPCLERLNHQVFLNLFRPMQKDKCSLKNRRDSIFKKVKNNQIDY